MSKYPDQEEIHKLFKNLSNGRSDDFFARVADDVDWTVMGTHPLAGHYTSKADLKESTLTRLNKALKPPGTQLAVRNIIGGGSAGPWVAVELVINAECLDGFKFDMCYTWCVRFNEEGIIVQLRAYLDSWMVREAIIRHETPSRRAEVPDVKKL